MTAEPFITIWCDAGFDPETGHRPCPHFYESGERTAARARKAVAASGWRHFSNPSRDFCPEHLRELGL